jgi:hypothetical protein
MNSTSIHFKRDYTIQHTLEVQCEGAARQERLALLRAAVRPALVLARSASSSPPPRPALRQAPDHQMVLT